MKYEYVRKLELIKVLDIFILFFQLYKVLDTFLIMTSCTACV